MCNCGNHGDCMVGKCEVCGAENVPLERKYFHYDIPCQCHGPSHFIAINHCEKCEPKEPRETWLCVKTEDLKNPRAFAQKIIDFAEQQANKRYLESASLRTDRKYQ